MSESTIEWQFVDVDGIRTRYREAGSGKPIVFFHGGEFGGGGAFTWPPELLEALGASGFRAIAVDRLGQGWTDNPPDESQYRMSVVIDHAAAFIRAIGAEGATVVGQSRGGYVAARLTMVYPDLIERLIILNSGSVSVRYPAEPVPGLPTYHVYHELANGDVKHDAALMSVTTDHLTDEWVTERASAAELPKSAVASEIRKKVHEAFFEEFEADKAATLKWMIGGGLTKPVLIVWGVGDPTLTPQDAVELFNVLAPHVALLRAKFINRSGHWPHREYPLEVADEIARFMRLEAPAPGGPSGQVEVDT